MKKDLFIYAALCALVAAGCSKQDEAETLQPEQGKAVNVTINATRHETPSTRTEYEDGADKLIVKWNSDKSDKLGVFTGNKQTSNALFVVDGDLLAEGKAANFKGSLNVSWSGQETTIYGYYPYNSAAGDTPEAIPIDLSGQQQVGITDKASLAHLAAKDYMAATPVTKNLNNGDQSLSLEFNPLLTILSFEIKQAMNVNFIRLEAVGDNNKTPFYTRRAVDITSTTPYFIPGGTKQSSVELNVTNGTIAAGATGMFNMMIFPIAEYAMPAQFKVTVTTTDGTVYTQTKDVPKDYGFVRGKRSIMALNNLTVEAADIWDGSAPTADDNYAYSGGEGTVENPYQIGTAKDLAQLAVNVNAGFDISDNFILTKNIDLNGKEWTPIGKMGKVFQGTFDGGGKVITGMKITNDTSNNTYVGLFGYVDGGTIKNINVAGEITIDANSAKAIYAGGISGYCYDATLSGNLTSHVNITITNTDSGFLRIGGVTGFSNTNTNKAFANVTLVNDGTLSAKGPAEVNVGGVIGYVMTDIEQGTTLINSGAVSGTSSGKKCRVGGLIGYSDNAVTCNGTNTGSVMGQISGGTDAVCSGGFIGYAGTTVKIDSNRNTGTVMAENKSTADSYAGIRVGGSSTLKVIENVNKDADGNPGSTDGVTATAKNGKSYVNGVDTAPIL